MSYGPSKQQVTDTLKEQGECSTSGVANALDVDWDATNRVLHDLRSNGEVERVPNESVPRVTWKLKA